MEHPVPQSLEFPPGPEVPQLHPRGHVEPPVVFVQPVWEYKHLVRRIPGEEPLDQDELNRLGTEGWELVGLYTDSTTLHFYLKRLVR